MSLTLFYDPVYVATNRLTFSTSLQPVFNQTAKPSHQQPQHYVTIVTIISANSDDVAFIANLHEVRVPNYKYFCINYTRRICK